jgi:hypothetical protein
MDKGSRSSSDEREGATAVARRILRALRVRGDRIPREPQEGARIPVLPVAMRQSDDSFAGARDPNPVESKPTLGPCPACNNRGCQVYARSLASSVRTARTTFTPVTDAAPYERLSGRRTLDGSPSVAIRRLIRHLTNA